MKKLEAKVERDIWQNMYDLAALPSFPCPSCSIGRLIAQNHPVAVIEPTYSQVARDDDDWEPDWVTQRFSAQFACNNKECGELSYMVGETRLTEFYEEYGEIYYKEAAVAHAFCPAPKMIGVPKETPWNVYPVVLEVFSSFWVSNAACANRIRAAIEEILDVFSIPREGISNNGKTHNIDLNGRIQMFQKNNSADAETLNALRVLGNIGSHSTFIDRNKVLDALELLEDVLENLFGDRRDYLNSLKKKIIATKGKY